MRGLQNFIKECLEVQSKELEKARVNKELSNIRKNFGGSNLNGYNRKKYVAKLLYIHLLGYTYDFGFPQMVELVTSNVFSEKQVGYITLGVMLNGNYDLVTMLIEHFRKEIKNYENEPAQCLALAAAANIGGSEVAETLSSTILQALTNSKNSNYVKKSAALALCRLYRDNPSVLVIDDNFVGTLTNLLRDPDIGVQMSVSSLVQIILNKNSQQFSSLFPIAIDQLSKLFRDATLIPIDYTYGHTPAPWLILKLMRIIQHKNKWSEDDKFNVTRIMDSCLSKTDLTLPVKDINTNMILLFEAINLIISADLSHELVQKCTDILGGFLSAKQSNVRYLALETLTRLVMVDKSVIPSLDKHRQTLYLALRDPDNSIRRRALSLLFAICTPQSAEQIVHELLNYLRFADITMREPLCLKIAVLAEQFAEDPAWFVDVVIQLISMAGDECNDGVWYRVVQVVSRVPGLQRYAAMTTYNSMTVGKPHDRLICLAAQLVGEYCELIEISPEEVSKQLISKFIIGNSIAKGIILSSLAKIGAKFSDVRSNILTFMNSLRGSQIIDIQQRAIEYSALLGSTQDVLAAVFKSIPEFNKGTSSLLKKVLEEHQKDENSDKSEEESVDEDESNFITKYPSKSVEPTPIINNNMNIQKPQKHNDEDDLLISISTPSNSKPSIQPQPEKPKPSPNNTDLLGIGELLDTSFTEQPKQTQLFSKPINTKETLFKNFLIQDTGIAYEDQFCEVSLSIQFNSPNIILSFQIHNKSSGFLNSLSIHIPPVPFLKISSKLGSSNLQSGDNTLYQFAISPVEPFIESPNYSIRFKYGEQNINELLTLPIFITKFVSPYNMDHQTFFSRWGSLNSPNQLASAKYPSKGGDSNQQMKNLITSLLHVPILNLQVPPNNVCGAGIINTETGTHGILVRFYDENGLININIKGTSSQVTASIQKILDNYFK